MALEMLAQGGHVMHVYDFRVKSGAGEDFIRLFDEFDRSDENLMHKTSDQIKDGVLCRDNTNPDHFYLIGEWSSEQTHRQILAQFRAQGTLPPFMGLIEGDGFVPVYATVVAPNYE